MVVSQIDATKVLSVGELTRQIKRTLETEFPPVWLRGEISGLNFHQSGHLYLTIKDADAQISAVMWRSRISRLEVRPENGQEVLVYGHLVVYERGGKYQLDLELIQPAGIGALAIEFEKLKKRLEAEGLFAPERKKPLPLFPRTIGVITSASGAAVRDILVTLSRRGFNLDVVFVPSKVQGDGAAEEIADAIKRLEQLDPKPDLLILGRGGGSIEDLWAFNEETTVRAVADCSIPVISGVGHETDFTLTDLVADKRAPTPTAAAEHATRDRLEIQRQVSQVGYRLVNTISGVLEGFKLRLESASGAYGLRRLPDRINQAIQTLDDFDYRSKNALKNGLTRRFDRLENFHDRLTALSPRSVLDRGYALVEKDKKLVTDGSKLENGDILDITLAKGKTKASVIYKNKGQ